MALSKELWQMYIGQVRGAQLYLNLLMAFYCLILVTDSPHDENGSVGHCQGTAHKVNPTGVQTKILISN